MSADSRANRVVERARQAAVRLDLDPSGARLLRLRQSALVELPAAAAIARVEAGDRAASARAQAAAGRFFAAHGAPVMRPVGRGPQPVLFTDAGVTVWERVPDDGRTPALVDLGRTLRALHLHPIDAWSGALPALDPLGEIHRHIGAIRSPADQAALAAAARVAADHWHRWAPVDPWGRALVHGDPHLGNVVSTPHGPVMVDLEFCGVGPASWDLVPLALHVERYGVPESHFVEVARGYGADPRGWSGFPALVTVYRLLCAAWTVSLAERDASLIGEARRRMQTLFEGADHRWTLA